MKKMNVESFNLDHRKVKAPYVRLVTVTEGKRGDKIYKYDVRFCQPNKEHMEMPTVHSLEHLMAELIRNHHESIFDVSPMGCQTGFYISVINDGDYDRFLHVLEKTLEDILQAKEVPAENEIQCGWAASHDLNGAKEMARKMLEKKSEWSIVFSE
ncbi:S-ribosylhomocysteine lyase [Fervidibacillus halotolerans]|uniref:S-ribosylhomocysteine lyase n=1 Tax=Fervidibacillus halotolerans TaxID=2980027 RepID=A0A9E8RYY5_9BACI|nr:S-ribosylhomocysteine lyase [Fervidibacillus halotolerans]WAA13321.1 S-ribosylhomocysteine lyase [Fervidibacillus halotolerans]